MGDQGMQLRMPRTTRIYYGWINVLMAAVAMTATLPGRTHGLGLISKPLLDDLAISESTFAMVNLYSTLLGAAFAIPMGLLIDRFGVRWLCVTVLLGLALSVYGMSTVDDIGGLFLFLVLIRGLGQSALSTLSIAMVSKWFRGRLAMAMGLFSVLLTFGFIGSVLGVGWAVVDWGWRSAWQSISIVLLCLTPVFSLLVRSSPEACKLPLDPATGDTSIDATMSISDTTDYTLRETLRTPTFWIVILATSTFNLVWSSITLFNEMILAELYFEQTAAVEMMAALTGFGLISNLIAGKFVNANNLGRLLGYAMFAMAAALALFPKIETQNQLRIYGSVLGFVGGIITVVHFSAWGQLFGRRSIGSIQGAAQLASVLASAIGPVGLAWYANQHSSHLPAFYWMAGLASITAIGNFFLPAPIQHRNNST